MRSAVELAKLWRQDKALRFLQAEILVADKNTTLVVSGAVGKGLGFKLGALAAPRTRSQYTSGRVEMFSAYCALSEIPFEILEGQSVLSQRVCAFSRPLPVPFLPDSQCPCGWPVHPPKGVTSLRYLSAPSLSDFAFSQSQSESSENQPVLPRDCQTAPAHARSASDFSVSAFFVRLCPLTKSA
eukprot:1159733-Pelagomonas_calceolata.AAC.4